MLARIGRRLKTLVAVVVIAEVVYLVLVNAALRLPVTQTLVNHVKPEKFHVSWERAWTWYPFRVHAEGIAANGQSRTQQWQLSSPRASGSIAILPLLLKRVWLREVVASDIDYRQRPRLKPGVDYTERLSFFPAIEGREVTGVASTPLPHRRPWHLAVDDMRAVGQHQLWIYHARANVTGSARGDLTYQTRGGPFSMDVHALDLQVGQLVLNGDKQVFRRGSVSGELGFEPFVPRDHKDIGLLQFVTLDLEVGVDVDDLSFLDLFTLDFNSMTIDGSGEIGGRLQFDRGTLLAGTDISVDADELRVRLLEHSIEGEGVVKLEPGGQSGQEMNLDIVYRDVQVFQDGEPAPLLVGQHLELSLAGSGYVLPESDASDRHRRVSATVEDLAVPDLALVQRYLPPTWPLTLHGGEGRFQAQAALSSSAIALELQISSEAADLAVDQYRFNTNLNALLKLDNPDYLAGSTSVAGSHLEIGNSSLARDGTTTGRPWDASVHIRQGEFSFLSERQRRQGEDFADLLQIVGTVDASDLLAQSKGSLQLDAELSRLGWLGIFLKSDLITAVHGSGSLSGDLYLTAGLPAAGTDLKVHSANLGVDILDYTGLGLGDIRLRVAEVDDLADWEFDIYLQDAELRRRSGSYPVVDEVSMRLRAVVEDVGFKPGPRDYALRFNIDSALVPDMGVFNDFLPAAATVRFAGGTASLKCDLTLQPEAAGGWLRLEGSALAVQAGNQTVTGDLDANIVLAGGRPADMLFDIKGSSLRLGQVFVRGGKEQFSGNYWSARLDLSTAQVQWRQPLELTAQAGLSMSDTRPFVAMFDNQSWRPQFLSRMLTVEDIEGAATLEASGNVFVFPDVTVTGDHLEVGARGTISEVGRDGVVYVRYRKADALLRIEGGRKNLDVIRAHRKYQDYRVGPLARSPSPEVAR